jgi:hypothetical protein
VGANNEAGSNWMRYRLSPAETACGIHRDWHASFEENFEKKFKIFEKSKNARNCLKSAQNQKI